AAGVKAGEAQSLGGHAIEVGRLEPLGPVTADVAVAQVVGKNDDDVRTIFPASVDGSRHQPRKTTQKCDHPLVVHVQYSQPKGSSTPAHTAAQPPLASIIILRTSCEKKRLSCGDGRVVSLHVCEHRVAVLLRVRISLPKESAMSSPNDSPLADTAEMPALGK